MAPKDNRNMPNAKKPASQGNPSDAAAILRRALRARAVLFALGAFVAVFAVLDTAGPVQDSDFWWHLKTGQLIAAAGRVPTADVFSYTIRGRPWVAFEWLSQLTYWKIYERFSFAGIFWLRESLVVLIFGLLLSFGASEPWLAAAALIAALPFARMGVTDRPQMFTFLLIVVYRLLTPALLEARSRRRLFGLAALFAALHVLWANLHGGASLVGILIVGAHAAGLWWVAPEQRRRTAARLGGLALLLAAASLANPVGWILYKHLARTLLDPGSKLVGEWLPPKFSDSYCRYYCLWLGAAFAASFGLPAGRRATAWALLLFFGGIEAFQSARNLVLGFFVIAPDALAGLAALGSSWSRIPEPVVAKSQKGRRSPEVRDGRIWFLLAGPAALAAVLFAARPAMLARCYPAYFASDSLVKEYGRGAADFLASHRMKGRMLNDYILGGYFIWRGREVFVDGRSLEYGGDFLKRALRWSDPAVFAELDARWHFDYAVFRQGESYLARRFDEDPDWSCVYFDDATLVYAHKGRADSRVARTLGYRFLRPNETSFDYLVPHLRDPRERVAVLLDAFRAEKSADREFSYNIHRLRRFVVQDLRAR